MNRRGKKTSKLYKPRAHDHTVLAEMVMELLLDCPIIDIIENIWQIDGKALDIGSSFCIKVFQFFVPLDLSIHRSLFNFPFEHGHNDQHTLFIWFFDWHRFSIHFDDKHE